MWWLRFWSIAPSIIVVLFFALMIWFLCLIAKTVTFNRKAVWKDLGT